MDKFSTEALGGMPRSLNDIRWFLGQASNQGVYQALNGMLGSFGTNFIIDGCELSGTVGSQNMSAGWILFGGELLRVDAVSDNSINTVANAYFTKVTSGFDTSGTKTMQSGLFVEAYRKDRGVVNTSSGNLSVVTGDRYKDQFDEWKEFDVSGTNINFVSNDLTFGSGSVVNLHQENAVNSYFRYRKVGNTVNWSFNFDFHLKAFNTAGTIQSLVIRNLPWSADKSQTQLVRLDSWASHLFTSGNALLSQVGSSDEMTITLQMFTKFGIELNRYHTFDITPSMSVVATSGGDASISRWVMRGSGTFEVS